MQKQIREAGKSGKLDSIIDTERTTIESDLNRFANSPEMVSSLKNALIGIDAIERYIVIVDNPDKYRLVDLEFSLPKNRNGGLPYDESRQALTSHYTRLNNLDKFWLIKIEKKIIDARKSAVFLPSLINIRTAKQIP